MLTCSLDTSYGTLGSSQGNFHLPYGITSNMVSNILYVSDCNNNRIVSLQSNGVNIAPQWIRTYGGITAGAGKGKFNCPRLLTFDEQSGHLYVADGFNNRVVRFHPNKFESTFTSFGSIPSTCNSAFQAPRGVTTDTNGHVWVTDTGNNRVIRFDPMNYQTTCTAFGSSGSGTGQFSYPYGIAFDNIHSLVYVADANNQRIVQFDPANFMTSFVSFPSSGPSGPHFGTALRSLLYEAVSGYLYAGDASNNRIIRFHPSNFANTFQSFGSAGSGLGQFNYPYAISFDSMGTAFVTDSNNNRVESFSCQGSVVTNPTYEPTQKPTSESTSVSIATPSNEPTPVGYVSHFPIQSTSLPTLAYGASYKPSRPLISRYPSIAPAQALSKATAASPGPLLALLTLLVLFPLACLCCCLLFKKVKYSEPEENAGETEAGAGE